MFHDLMTHHDLPTFEDLFDDPVARRHIAPRPPVAIRPLRAGDVDSVAAVLLGMTPQDRWFRFTLGDGDFHARLPVRAVAGAA